MADHRTLTRVTITFLTLAVLAPLAVGAVVASWLLFPPPLEQLPDPRPPGGSQLSRVHDATGREIAILREFDQRLPVKPEDIPQVLKQAVVSVEDQSFYTNNGLDLSGTLRALIANIRGQEIVQGGSTITQQYVKNAYVGTERTLERKIKEAVLARQLTRVVDKDEVLFNYLDGIYLGEGAFGVGAASQSYFRKPVNELSLSEAAMLAGLIPAPSRYEPRGNLDAAEARRVVVLDAMLDQAYISPDEYAEAKRLRLWLTTDGPAPRRSTLVYPPSDPADNEHPYFVDYVRRYLESKYGQAVYAGGLEIRTTLDPRLQELADRTVDEALEGTQSPIEMALVSLDPRTGFVLAMVGGREFSAEAGQVNLALGNCAFPPPEVRDKVDVAARCWNPESVVVEGGGTGRQPGSSWKSMVLATALEQGVSDRKVYRAPSVYRIPGCIGKVGCQVNNYEGSAAGRVTLRKATERSYNTVYAQVINEVGVPEVAEMAKRLGVNSAWVASPEIHGTSYALGAQEVSPRHGIGLRGLCHQRPAPAGLAGAVGEERPGRVPRGQPPAPARAGARRAGGLQRHRHPQRRYQPGNGDQGRHRTSGGGQDRHRPGVARRLVRGLHPGTFYIGVDRRQDQAHVAVRHQGCPAGHRRLDPGRDVERLHERGFGRRGPERLRRAPPPPAPPPRPPRASPPPPAITIAPQTTPTTRSITTTTLPPTTTTTRRTFQLPSNETTTTTQPIVPRNRRADRERTTITTRRTTTTAPLF